MPILNPLDEAPEAGDLDHYDNELPPGLHEVVVEEAEEDAFYDGEEAISVTLVNHELAAYARVKLGRPTYWLVRQLARVVGLRGAIEPEHLIGVRLRVRVRESRDGYLNVNRILASKKSAKRSLKRIEDEPVVKAARNLLDAELADSLEGEEPKASQSKRRRKRSRRGDEPAQEIPV
jgi:hypothetical protein